MNAKKKKHISSMRIVFEILLNKNNVRSPLIRHWIANSLKVLVRT